MSDIPQSPPEDALLGLVGYFVMVLCVLWVLLLIANL